jgi:hypothetical protein
MYDQYTNMHTDSAVIRVPEHTFVRSNAVHSMNTFLVLSVILEWFPLIIGGIDIITPLLS